MQRDEMIAMIARGNEMLDEGGDPQETGRYLAALEEFKADHPDVWANEETRERLFALDDEMREAGDRRPYLARWEDAVRELEGLSSPYQAMAERLDTDGAAVVHYLRTGRLPVAEEPEDDPGAIERMAATRANARIVGQEK